eukprot:202082_1
MTRKKNQYTIMDFDFLMTIKKTENICESDDEINVVPKFRSLKEELTCNEISHISIDRFNNEYQKAQIHFNTKYRKQHFTDMPLEFILSVIIYCNCDIMQAAFSKTYRLYGGKKHTNFYYLGKNLKAAVHQFGTQINNGDVFIFYHGIGAKLHFPQYIGRQYYDGIQIYAPLSTSASFGVAANFANHNQGLIIHFASSRNNRYFSTSWLSDYPNEKK